MEVIRSLQGRLVVLKIGISDYCGGVTVRNEGFKLKNPRAVKVWKSRQVFEPIQVD
jgi:hypothetical protein